MRFKGASYRQTNYYSSSSWDNKPPTKEQIRANKIFYGIPIAIFSFLMVIAFYSFVIDRAIQEGVFLQLILIVSFSVWIARKIRNKEKFK